MAKVSHFKCQRSRILLALLAGACGTLAFSPYDVWLAAIISLCGLLIIIIKCTVKQSVLLGFCWGLGFFGSGVNWVYVSIANCGGTPFAINILLVSLFCSYLSLYTSLFSGLLVGLWTMPCCWRLTIAAPVLWQVTEFLRGWALTGFPWLQFGYSQISGPLKGVAPLLGVDAITFILMTIAGLLVYAINLYRIVPVFIAIMLLFLPALLQYWPLFNPLTGKAVNIAIVQGNIPQSLQWSPQDLASTLQIYFNATQQYMGKASIIIWPESAIPDYEARQNKFLIMVDKSMRAANSSLITGIISTHVTPHGQRKIYNSAIALGTSTPYSAQATERYNKHHLVPFGEFVPLGGMLRPLAPLFNLPMSSFNRGNYIQPQIHIKGYLFTVAICYEIILGQQVRDNFQLNTDFLVAISNDSWFGHSVASWQHLQMARMRALELGRPLLHSTNNGITAAIDANGKIIAKIPQFTRRVLEVNLTPTTGVTPYARFGARPLWIINLLLGGWLFMQSPHWKLCLKIKSQLKNLTTRIVSYK